MKLTVNKFNFSKEGGQGPAGFTLLEITAVLAIVGLSLLGVSSLMLQGLRVKQSHQHYLAASMLAQEGAELVRNRRDSNWLASADWIGGDGLDPDTDILQDGHFTIDPITGTVDNAPDSLDHADARLYYDSVNDFYTHEASGNTATVYRRLIEVSDQGGHIDATSTVRWQAQSGPQNYIVSFKLYDWR